MVAELLDKKQLFPNHIPPSKTAFSAARLKILIPFFIDLFLFTVSLFYKDKKFTKTWKGFRLLAVDGSAVIVPESKENRFLFGVHENQHGGVAACKILAVHDVLNRVFVNVFFHPRAIAELSALHYNFDKLPNDAIIIYDRHYCDSLLMHRHLKANKKCIIRMKGKGINVVEKFLALNTDSALMELQIGERAYYSARDKYDLKNNHPRFHKFKMRFIKVILPNGEIEILASNLFDEEKYPTKDFKMLYGKRWGVETAFDEIKNQLKLPVFSGYKSQIVFQDLWAVFIFYNIRAMFLSHTEYDLNQKKKEQQINRNTAIAIIRNSWTDLLLKPIKSKPFKKLFFLIKRYHFKTRIRPPTVRKKKLMRANERYMTEKNYKPAF